VSGLVGVTLVKLLFPENHSCSQLSAGRGHSRKVMLVWPGMEQRWIPAFAGMTNRQTGMALRLRGNDESVRGND